MVIVMLPEIMSFSITFEKMLAINVCYLGVTLVNEMIQGRSKFLYMLSRNVAESLLVSYFRISILKSPMIMISLFSEESFSRMFWRKTSLNSVTSIHGCLYMHPTIVFFPFLFIISIKTDSSSLYLQIFRSFLILKFISLFR